MELLLLRYEFLNAQRIYFCLDSSGYPAYGIMTLAIAICLWILHKPNILKMRALSQGLGKIRKSPKSV